MFDDAFGCYPFDVRWLSFGFLEFEFEFEFEFVFLSRSHSLTFSHSSIFATDAD